MDLTLADFSIRIGISVLLGFFIGIERELTGHPAGVQTNTLVCLGSCIFVLASFNFPETEAARIAAQIISGVGFLGTGIIFKDGANVKGINTAATIWCAAAVGILTSVGQIIFALIATAAIVLVNLIFQQRVKKERKAKGKTDKLEK
ncbi:MAG: MgtC/SapB family protein [Clostridiales bacterium]|jgi:putative Mg2+ transporter-C (MgtC) family protein|nr:MgtC/SapB family protein [Clostridiales bacterium]